MNHNKHSCWHNLLFIIIMIVVASFSSARAFFSCRLIISTPRRPAAAAAPFWIRRRRLTSTATTTTVVAPRCFLLRRSSLGAGPGAAAAALLAAAAASGFTAVNGNNNNNNTSTYCTPPSNEEEEENDVVESHLLFPESCLEYDHYNGVTVHLDHRYINNNDDDDDDDDDSIPASLSFEAALQRNLEIWRDQGKKGVWLHVNAANHADKIAAAVSAGFDFHMVIPTTADSSNNTNNTLVLSKWLPTDSESRLPAGPSHQVGVGCLVWHPDDDPKKNDYHQRRLLVVQERTGPAASWKLWKMPTGLADASEDVHDAAIRELYEETGLSATFDGVLLLRQAHKTPPPQQAINGDSNDNNNKSTNTARSVSRKASDLFFVCQLSLIHDKDNDESVNGRVNGSNNTNDDDHDNYWQERFTKCPDEIAAIQWMTVTDYCNQELWQNSPVYMELNRAILNATEHGLWHNTTLPLRSNSSTTISNTTTTTTAAHHQPTLLHTNTLYKSKEL